MNDNPNPKSAAVTKAPAKKPRDDAKSLRRAFRVPTTEQVKKTAKRLFKVNRYGKSVPDKDVLATLQTYKYKTKLAKELDDADKKTSPE